ncbi:MAG: bifunctional hydroxymethylpyrimidine kinase/phosphomethylpyrimidine kinase [Nitrospiraceae bacterium]|nr:bifunctional hydroxymethylpyrimidine kinase/phosphomethylpyrimidine kinase [Nitrospiraceae bacterium]
MIAVLTIAGSDPSGGAGIQQDLKVFRSFGTYGLSVVSSLTAQSSAGVAGVMAVPGKFVTKQLAVVVADIMPDAIKTGMLYSEENVNAVAAAIRRFSLPNVVVDPVIRSSTGRSLCMGNVPGAMKKRLLPLCTVVTPNIHEASILSGMRIRTLRDMEKAAVKLAHLGAGSVIITGGHLEAAATDLVYDGRFHYLKGRKISGEYHGTGCTFSAALASLLAKGESVPSAALKAKKFMGSAFRKTFSPGTGMRLFDI